MNKGHIARSLGPFLTTSAVAGAVLTILAPYGTNYLPFFARLLFWTGLCFAGGLGAAFAKGLFKTSDKSPWVRAAIHSAGSTLFVCLCFLGLHAISPGMGQPGNHLLLLFYIWVIAIVICGVGVLMENRNKPNIETAQRAPIFKRLKPGLRRSKLYALSAEDHYVRVHTSDGDALILMRLSDAITETAPTPGLQTHRSWWVADAGVNAVSRQNGKTRIIMQNGIEAPVSRANLNALKDKNWG